MLFKSTLYTDHEGDINIKLNPRICCPELVGTNLTVDVACANDKCGKPVATVAACSREREL